jgi:hypothetical protein
VQTFQAKASEGLHKDAQPELGVIDLQRDTAAEALS